jgi:hypothetical protein
LARNHAALRLSQFKVPFPTAMIWCNSPRETESSPGLFLGVRTPHQETKFRTACSPTNTLATPLRIVVEHFREPDRFGSGKVVVE